MAQISTKQKFLSLIEDVEIVARELFELMSTPKGQQRADAPEQGELIQLLIKKDKDIKETLKLASEQGKVQVVIDELKAEVDKRDMDIKILQKNLKEAENILSTALFQAKEKLTAIEQANNKKISSEELIKYAHRISASNAVAAPPTWAPGDPRRPYPTDFEMRSGCLAKMSDIPASTQTSQTQGTYTDSTSTRQSSVQMSDHMLQTQSSHHSTSSLSWQPSSDNTVGHLASGSHHPLSDMRGHNKENEEVELMSTDSSSSSSSDE
ncbi:hypothetical protein CHS0354_009161 [Potamilus streckersoni]|uniref:Mediator of RNA polymerase II transcription subunit 4 n=1 Tax=Potamilus streckersoni TaxID=2493646 RepID=A0AAE0VLA2_9BIVA|nr:hypothetical protein CHS0354_009161 [Potamilus streckersoni]